MQSFNFQAIGTDWQIDFYDTIEPSRLKVIKKEIAERITIFRNNYSRFLSHSWVSSISKNPGTYAYPQDLNKLYDIYKKLNKLSDGLFTPLIGKVMEDAGYDMNYTLTAGKLTSPPELKKTVQLNKNKITLREKVLLDFGAAGKGYLVDIIGDLFEKASIPSYCIDAGGDILHKNDKSTHSVSWTAYLVTRICSTKPNAT